MLLEELVINLQLARGQGLVRMAAVVRADVLEEQA
jgi:hypothetical protein